MEKTIIFTFSQKVKFGWEKNKNERTTPNKINCSPKPIYQNHYHMDFALSIEENEGFFC